MERPPQERHHGTAGEPAGGRLSDVERIQYGLLKAHTDAGGRQSRGEWVLSCGDTRSEMGVRTRLWW